MAIEEIFPQTQRMYNFLKSESVENTSPDEEIKKIALKILIFTPVIGQIAVASYMIWDVLTKEEDLFVKGLEKWAQENPWEYREIAKGLILNAYSEEMLNLSGLGLTSLPEELAKLTDLKFIIISGNGFDSFPLVLGKLNLQLLDISNNKLVSLPAIIEKLPNLRFLDISDNELMAIPPTIEKLTQLKYLNLDSNQLVELPKEMGNLTKLKYLNVSYNDPSMQVPREVENLSIETFLKD